MASAQSSGKLRGQGPDLSKPNKGKKKLNKIVREEARQAL